MFSVRLISSGVVFGSVFVYIENIGMIRNRLNRCRLIM